MNERREKRVESEKREGGERQEGWRGWERQSEGEEEERGDENFKEQQRMNERGWETGEGRRGCLKTERKDGSIFRKAQMTDALLTVQILHLQFHLGQ